LEVAAVAPLNVFPKKRVRLIPLDFQHILTAGPAGQPYLLTVYVQTPDVKV
jgi:hypothetical protein